MDMPMRLRLIELWLLPVGGIWILHAAESSVTRTNIRPA